jgi:hypothetical protein
MPCMSPIAIMRFAWSSDCNCKSLALGTIAQSNTYGKHTVGNVLYKISIIVAKVREVFDGSEFTAQQGLIQTKDLPTFCFKARFPISWRTPSTNTKIRKKATTTNEK